MAITGVFITPAALSANHIPNGLHEHGTRRAFVLQGEDCLLLSDPPDKKERERRRLQIVQSIQAELPCADVLVLYAGHLGDALKMLYDELGLGAADFPRQVIVLVCPCNKERFRAIAPNNPVLGFAFDISNGRDIQILACDCGGRTEMHKLFEGFLATGKPSLET